MKIKKSFIRIALAAGLVGIAACSGSSASDSTVVRQKNAALATNVQKYVGSATSENWEDDSNTDYTNVAFRKDDKYQFSFDLNLDAVDANTNAPSSIPECWVETDGNITALQVLTATHTRITLGTAVRWKLTSEVHSVIFQSLEYQPMLEQRTYQQSSGQSVRL